MNNLEDFHQNARTPLRICCRPPDLRGFGDQDGLPKFARACESHARLDVARGGIKHVSVPFALTNDPATANEMADLMCIMSALHSMLAIALHELQGSRYGAKSRCRCAQKYA